jgi:hypothetical protein
MPCLQRERQLTRRSHVPNKKELGKGQSVTCRIGKHPADEGPFRSLRNVFFFCRNATLSTGFDARTGLYRSP